MTQITKFRNEGGETSTAMLQKQKGLEGNTENSHAPRMRWAKPKKEKKRLKLTQEENTRMGNSKTDALWFSSTV